MDTNLSKFKGRLPYASEIIGCFQPLLGWKSRLIQNRLNSRLALPDFPRVLEVDAPRNSDHIHLRFAPGAELEFVDGRALPPQGLLDVFAGNAQLIRFQTPGFVDSLMARSLQLELRDQLADHPPEDAAFWGPVWEDLLTKSQLNKRMTKIAEFLTGKDPFTKPADPAGGDPLLEYIQRVRLGFATIEEAVTYVFNKEVYVARYLNSLLPAEGADAAAFPAGVTKLLLQQIPSPTLRQLLELLDPLNLAKGVGREAVLSPIGTIDLFRQYYFEFENFLGAPVEHVWLSPGCTTELIEVSTRRVLQEYTLEKLAETIERSESASTLQDELSEAVRDENTRNTKLGSTVSGGASILIAHIEASGSMSSEETQKRAREETHKTSRQQSAKLSSEIRSSVKTAFRTVSEVTDMRSKRYTISNTTNELINYELRRKMRQVGVQQQDLGRQLCWQTYIDDPGADLGVAQLVHLASKTDLSQFNHQAHKPVPQAIVQTVTILLPVPNPGDSSNIGPIAAAAAAGFVVGSIPGAIVAVGVEEVLQDLFGDSDKSTSYDINTQTTIHQGFKINLPPGYLLAPKAQQPDDDAFPIHPEGDIPVRKIGGNGDKLLFRMNIMNASEGVMDLVVFGGGVTPGEVCTFQAMIAIVPTAEAVAGVKAENAGIDKANADKDLAADRKVREEFVGHVRNRVELASRIKSRPTDDLREEERTIVYRHLLKMLMRETWAENSDRKIAHLRSELIKSMFDVDKMLYFVAPEWWQPRRHSSLDIDAEMPAADTRLAGTAIDLNGPSKEAVKTAGTLDQFFKRRAARHSLGTLGNEDLIGWGGEGRPDNYLITENSTAARLGSSLGWLLQLDGDNLRNAFLNAPWVKAVIPIRPGKEKEALEWLKQSQVEGTQGLGDLYAGDDVEQLKAKFFSRHGVMRDLTIGDVLDLVADDIALKHQASNEVVKEQVAGDGGALTDLFYLRPDHVFEKGFDPLKGGFSATPRDQDGKPAFEIFDQWIEILPTDQIAAVEVEYDPKTGEMK